MSIFIHRIYTRSGDDGSTGLVGGSRISKGHLRIECYGTCDELLAVLGSLRTEAARSPVERLRDRSLVWLPMIQNELFDAGSLLASPPGPVPEGMPSLSEDQIRRLESEIDFMTADVPPLTSFVLPGGSRINADSHFARTVCRRLERLVIRLHETEEVEDKVRRYVNRLSDWLFAYGRFASKEEGVAEYLWSKGGK